MKINLVDILRVRLLIYGQLHRLSGLKQKIRTIINPFDIVRDIEFGYLLKMMNRSSIYPKTVLDVSSPYIFAYVLSAQCCVTKTDLNPAEREMIKEDANLKFQIEDGTRLSFKNDSFDLVYSISVIEHIYEKYVEAVKEMIRVLKPGGHLYLTFPVSDGHVEEWLDHRIYPEQFQRDGKAFFQYRFDKRDLHELLGSLDNVDVVDISLYWEKRAGIYDHFIRKMGKKPFIGMLRSVRNGCVSFWSSLVMLEHRHQGYDHAKPFGNASLFLKKRNL